MIHYDRALDQHLQAFNVPLMVRNDLTEAISAAFPRWSIDSQTCPLAHLFLIQRLNPVFKTTVRQWATRPPRYLLVSAHWRTNTVRMGRAIMRRWFVRAGTGEFKVAVKMVRCQGWVVLAGYAHHTLFVSPPIYVAEVMEQGK